MNLKQTKQDLPKLKVFEHGKFLKESCPWNITRKMVDKLMSTKFSQGRPIFTLVPFVCVAYSLLGKPTNYSSLQLPDRTYAKFRLMEMRAVSTSSMCVRKDKMHNLM